MLNCLNHGIQLQFVGGIVALGIIKLLAKKYYGVTLLAEDTTNAQVRGITRNLKGKSEVRHAKDGCLSE
jgi:hypothetical protein